jgi:hypothetical protein
MFKISKLIYKLYIQYTIYSTIILNVDGIGMPRVMTYDYSSFIIFLLADVLLRMCIFSRWDRL